MRIGQRALDAALPAGVEHPDRRWCLGSEDAYRVEELVKERAVVVTPRGRRLDDLEHLEAVTDGDVGDGATLGHHNDGDALQRRSRGGIADGRPFAGQGEVGKAGGIPAQGEGGGQFSRRRRGEEPSHAGADYIGAHENAQSEAQILVEACSFVPSHPHHEFSPVRSGRGLCAQGVPALLPGGPGLRLQPVDRGEQPVDVTAPGLSGKIAQQR